MASYLALGLLAVLASYLIYSEFQAYNAIQSGSKDSTKLLQTNLLLTELHEAENISKLALQTKKPAVLEKYVTKVSSIVPIIDSLKILSLNDTQSQRLDTVKQLLKQKEWNTAQLRRIKIEQENFTPIDSLLKTITELENDMGRITPEHFVSNFEQLPESTKKSLREYVALLNENVPSDTQGENLDSVLQISKSILTESKIKNSQLTESLVKKELEIYRTDLEISQKLRNIISELQMEIVVNTEYYQEQKQSVIERSILFGGGAALLGLLIVVLFTILISRDFLEVQRFKNQLENEKAYSESLLKSREQLISTVSHDLKSPLATVKGYTELLRQKSNDSKSQNHLGHIKNSLGYINTLVDDLLDFSRLEAGQLPIEKKSFFLKPILTNMTSGHGSLHQKKDIQFSIHVSNLLKTPIISDPIRLRQILNNLVGNAFKYTEKGFIKVQASVRKTSKGDYLKIKVIDSGMGIPKEKQRLIFKEFTQADETIYGKYGGYGLGLTIAQKLSHLLGGYLELESVLGKGSTFTLSLPLDFGSLVPEKKSMLPEPKSTYGVLIIEDDPALLGLLEEICKSNQLRTYGYSSNKALRESDIHDYDIVLTDINLPDINGFELLTSFKNKEFSHYSNQPVIAMTGQRTIHHDDFISAGFDAVLEKPFSSKMLLDTFQHLLPNSTQKSYEKQRAFSMEEHSLFNFQSISTFVDTHESLEKIILTFLQNTKKNMADLNNAIIKKQNISIGKIAHQMLPMFRQLEVDKAIPILEEMENAGNITRFKKVRYNYHHLQKIVRQLDFELKKVFFKHPIGRG